MDTATIVKLRSPFNGEVLSIEVSTAYPIEFVAELLKRGFVAEDQEFLDGLLKTPKAKSKGAR